MSFPNRYELEHPGPTPNDIESSKDWTKCIAPGIVGAYGDDILRIGLCCPLLDGFYYSLAVD